MEPNFTPGTTGMKISAEAKTSLFALGVFAPSESCNRGTHRAERIGSDFLRGQAPGRFDGALLHCQIIRMVHRCEAAVRSVPGGAMRQRALICQLGRGSFSTQRRMRSGTRRSHRAIGTGAS